MVNYIKTLEFNGKYFKEGDIVKVCLVDNNIFK